MSGQVSGQKSSAQALKGECIWLKSSQREEASVAGGQWRRICGQGGTGDVTVGVGSTPCRDLKTFAKGLAFYEGRWEVSLGWGSLTQAHSSCNVGK